MKNTRLLFDRLLALLAVDVAAVLTVVVESGKADFRLSGLTVAASVAAAVVACGRLLDDARPTDVEHTPSAPLDQTKKILLLAMVAGIVSLVGGRGTWSSFSAETRNPGSSVSSGLLTMSDKVNNATACLSTSASSADNYNAACDAVFAPTDLAPGSVNAYTSSFPLSGSTAGKGWFMSKIVIQNTGTIDASKLSVSAPYGNAVLTTQVSPGTVASLTFSGGFEGSVASGDSITLSYQGTSQTFCTSSNARPTQGTPVTTITIVATAGTCSQPTSTTSTWPSGTRVLDTSSDTTTTNTNCYDTKTAAAASYNFNLLTTNPLCQTLELWIQEQTSGSNYCWFGVGSTFNSPTANGMCVTPTTQQYAGSSISSGAAMPGSLALGTLNGNINTGDHVVIKESNASNECTVTGGPYYIGNAGTVSITSCSPATAATAYDSSAIVYDKTAYDALNTTASNTNSTISNFNTARNQGSGAIFLPPLTGNGAANAGAAVQLASGASRTFYVGVYFPSPSGSNQNNLQGLISTFGLLWHTDQ